MEKFWHDALKDVNERLDKLIEGQHQGNIKQAVIEHRVKIIEENDRSRARRVWAMLTAAMVAAIGSTTTVFLAVTNGTN